MSNNTPVGLKRHPLSAACGDMDPEEFIAMQESIAAIGVVEPITLFEGQVLDGWHRYTSAHDLEVPCPHIEFKGDYENARMYVWAKHGARRNWSKSQRAIARALLLALEESQGGGEVDKTTLSKAAQEANVSLRTMEQANRVVREGSKEVIAAVTSGDVSVKRADSVVDRPKREQGKALREPPAPRGKAAPGAGSPGTEVEKPSGGSTWKAAAQRMASPQVGVSREKVAELDERVQVLNDLNDELTARMAVHFMEGTDDERQAAATLIAELQAENKQLRHDYAALKDSRDTAVSELNEMRRQCAMYRNQLTKLSKKAA